MEMTNLHIAMRTVAQNPPSDDPQDPLEISFRRMLSEKPIEFWREYHRLEKEWMEQCKAEEVEAKPKGDVGTQKCREMAERLLEKITGKKLRAV